MRIIAGIHKGRAIRTSKAAPHIRPSSAFLRQAVFNILTHSHAETLEATRVADICCGTGALGLEALSRGASHVTFVDADMHALQAARANAEQFGEAARSRFIRAEAQKLPRANAPYALVLIDPPYFSGVLPPCLTSLKAEGWTQPGTVIMIEHDQGETSAIPEGFTQLDTRRYGRAVVGLLVAG